MMFHTPFRAVAPYSPPYCISFSRMPYIDCVICRENFLLNAAECREAMESLLLEAYAFRQASEKAEREKCDTCMRLAQNKEVGIVALNPRCFI